MSLEAAPVAPSALPRMPRLHGAQWWGLAILGAMVAAAVAGPLVSPYNSHALVCEPFARPDAAHWLGCNDVGQDILTRLLESGRISLFVGAAVAALASLVATALAIAAGLSGGLFDRIAMRLVDVVMALPFLPLVIVLGAFFGASVVTQVLVITFVMWAEPVRELRSAVLSLRSGEAVEAAGMMGAGPWWIATRHILPALTPLVVPQFVRVARNAILVESALSFLGLGDPTSTSWGTMLFLANARTAFLTDAWINWIMPPGLAIALAVVAFALVGFDVGRLGRTRRTETAPMVPAAPAVATDARLSIQNLTVRYGADIAVDGFSLDVRAGEIVGLVGGSGSGKTTVGLTVLGLLPPGASSSGHVLLDGASLTGLPPAALGKLRGRRIALIPQSAMNALNPVMTVGTQIAEAIRLHQDIGRRAAGREARDLLSLVGLPPERAGAYPHELSGGMRQRVVIAIAVANRPEVIIADEPTTGLDVLVQAGIVDLIAGLRARLGLSVLFISHDLDLVARFADRLAVMHEGRLVDAGTAAALAATARNPETRAMFAAMPRLTDTKRWQRPPVDAADAPVVELAGVSRTFRRSRGASLRRKTTVSAVRDVSFAIRPGEVVGLVGASGAGKSTLARLVTGRLVPDAGAIRLLGEAHGTASPRTLAERVHMVFQDPYQSLSPTMRVGALVAEPLRIRGEADRAQIAGEVRDALRAVHLPADAAFLARHPATLSGGQRQRVAFARALVTRPALIVADEPTSMLDQSVRMSILALMEDLRRQRATSFLFITHDMILARHFCDRLLVMKDGAILEEGSPEAIAFTPRHPYTRELIAAVSPDPAVKAAS